MNKEIAINRITNVVNKKLSNDSQELKDLLVPFIYEVFRCLNSYYDNNYSSSSNLNYAISVVLDCWLEAAKIVVYCVK